MTTKRTIVNSPGPRTDSKGRQTIPSNPSLTPPTVRSGTKTGGSDPTSPRSTKGNGRSGR